MRLPGRAKVRVHTEMHLERSPLEPTAATPCKLRWLSHLRNAKLAGIEGARLGLTAGRHGKLNVIE
jgi:alkylhydroperoxidase family enzyme